MYRRSSDDYYSLIQEKIVFLYRIFLSTSAVGGKPGYLYVINNDSYKLFLIDIDDNVYCFHDWAIIRYCHWNIVDTAS